MNEIKLTIHPFKMGTEKEVAGKMLEEASEAREAAQQVRECNHRNGKWCGLCDWKDNKNVPLTCKYLKLADEIADVIQASCNLAARYGIDLQAAMQRCEQRNRARGRYPMEDEDAKAVGACGCDVCDCGGDCADVSLGVDNLPKSTEEMSAEELYKALKIAIAGGPACVAKLGEEWCESHGACSNCRLNILELIKEKHHKHIAELEYEVNYYKEKSQAWERDYNDLTHERDGLRRRLAELSDAGITALHRLLRKTIGDAKNAADTARHYAERAREKQSTEGANNADVDRVCECGMGNTANSDGAAASRGRGTFTVRNSHGDCNADRPETLSSVDSALAEERKAVIERLQGIDFTQDNVSLHEIGCAVLGNEPTPWWNSESRAELCYKLIELLSDGAQDA